MKSSQELLRRLATGWAELRREPWALWRRQAAIILGMELKKQLFPRRRFWVYLLAFAPVLIIGAHWVQISHVRRVRESFVSQHPSRSTHHDFDDITVGLSKEVLLFRLGDPPNKTSRVIKLADSGKVRTYERYQYSDGETDLIVTLTDGIVTDTQVVQGENLEGDTRILAGIFQIYYLRLGIFFGCMGIFTWLFRGEMVERSLHYYLLAPVRREVLVAAKFAAGAISSILLFATSIFLSFALMYGPYGPVGRAFVFSGPGLGQLGSYLLITVLACLGYGAMALALSLLFKNIVVPAVILLGWETISSAMPALMQKLSVTHYLKQLLPVPVPPAGVFALFTVVTEPIAPWVAVLGLLLLTLAGLVFACFYVRRLEINYVTD